MRNKLLAHAGLILLLTVGAIAHGQSLCPAGEVFIQRTETCEAVTSVPEPGTLILFATGMAGLVLAHQRRKRKQ